MQQPPNQPDWQHPQYYQQQPISPYTGQEYDPAWGTKVQPPAQPPRLPGWAILLMIAVVALIGAIVVYGASKSATTTTTTLTGAQIAATNSAQLAATNGASTVDTGSTPDTGINAAHFKVGDTATTPDGYIVTVLKTYTSQGDQYETPSAGNQYLVVDASVKNTTGKVQHMSESQFTLIDSTGQHIDNTFVSMNGIHTFIGGTLQDGATMRGQVVYEVPKGNHPYQFTFMGEIFGNYQTIWDVHS